MFQLKTEGFATLEEVLAYLKEVAPEVARIAKVEEEEKPALLRKRDELLNEAKTAKERATTLEAELTDLKSKGAGQGDAEAQEKYRSLYEADKAAFQKQLDEMKAEREREKTEAAAAQLKASAIAELSKPNYRLHNPEHFHRLHGDKLKVDPDTGELFIDLGDYKRQTVAQYVEDVETRPEEMHLFKPKGGAGAGTSTNTAGGATTSTENPFKTGNLTAQSKLFRENRALYDRLKAEAGK